MKLVINKLNRVIEEEVALALRFLRFEQQIDALEDLIATKITQRKFKQIIKEETRKALNEAVPVPSKPITKWYVYDKPKKKYLIDPATAKPKKFTAKELGPLKGQPGHFAASFQVGAGGKAGPWQPIDTVLKTITPAANVPPQPPVATEPARTGGATKGKAVNWPKTAAEWENATPFQKCMSQWGGADGEAIARQRKIAPVGVRSVKEEHIIELCRDSKHAAKVAKIYDQKLATGRGTVTSSKAAAAGSGEKIKADGRIYCVDLGGAPFDIDVFTVESGKCKLGAWRFPGPFTKDEAVAVAKKAKAAQEARIAARKWPIVFGAMLVEKGIWTKARCPDCRYTIENGEGIIITGYGTTRKKEVVKLTSRKGRAIRKAMRMLKEMLKEKGFIQWE